MDDLSRFANDTENELHSALGGEASRGIDYSTAARFQMFDRLAKALKLATSSRPVLIVVDDLHEADTDSLALVEFLAADLPRTRLAILASYRTEHVSEGAVFDRHLLPIVRNCAPHRIELSGLDLSEARALIALHTSWSEPDHEITESLSRRTAGNPFFIVETCRLANGRSDRQDFEVGIATTVRTLIRTRLAAISATCRTFLDVAAVIGTEFDATTVGYILGDDCQQTDLDGMISEALRYRFVRRTSLNVSHYAFTHSLVREVVYADLSPSTRRELHMKAANFFTLPPSSSSDPLLDVIAHHMYLAGDQFDLTETKAVLMRAGRRSLETLAYDKALRHLQRAAEIEGNSSSPEDHCELQLLLGEAQMKAGLWTEARVTFERTMTTARQACSAAHLAAAAIGLKGMTRGTLPPDATAVKALREALTVVPKEQARTRARLLTALSTALYFDRVEAEELPVLAGEAFESAESDGDIHVVGEALEAKILAAYRYDQIDQMLEHCTKLHTIANRAGIRDLEFRGRIFRYAGLSQRNDPRAITELDVCTQLAEELRHPRYLWQVHLAKASLALARGDLTEAADLCQQTRERGKRFHDPTSDQHLLMLRFTEAKIRQQYAALIEPLEQIISGAPEYPLPRAGLAFMHAAMGDMRKAAFTLAPITLGGLSGIRPDGFSLVTLCILAEITLYIPNPPWLKELEHRLQPYEDQLAIAGWGTAIEGSIAHFLALIKNAYGDAESALRLALKAHATNKLANLDLLASRSESLCAALLHQLGRHTEERPIAARADSFCQRAGLQTPRFGATCFCDHQADAKSSIVDISRSMGDSCQENHFVRQGEYWHIMYKGQELRMRDTKGMRHLHALLSHQGEFLLATTLVELSADPSTSEQTAAPRESHPAPDRSDLQALREYRSRLRDVNLELDDPDVKTNLGLVERLQAEKAYLEDFLVRESGLFNRQRKVGSVAEKARINVRNAISSAISRISAAHESLGRHFDCAIKTGRLCIYRPAESTEWVL